LPLPQPLPVRFTVLEEKFVGRTVYHGSLASVSGSEAAIECEQALVPLSNLKIELEACSGANPGGEIYAKVMGSLPGAVARTRIRFTSVSPDLKAWVLQMTAQPTAALAVAG
jgi:hypothetical protein